MAKPNVAAPAMAATGRLKIRVERNECKGHARCKSPAPELVELDEHGKRPWSSNERHRQQRISGHRSATPTKKPH
jgi:ferredoxin